MTIFLKKFRSKVFKKNKENQEERRVNKRGCSNKKNIVSSILIRIACIWMVVK
jgi:hypothetical protein